MIPPHWPKPTNDKLAKVYEALYAAGSTFGGGQDFSCPAHGDERASLGVTQGNTQPVLFKCQAGCTTPQILESLGLKSHDISSKRSSNPEGPTGKKLDSTQRWVYSDEVGHPLIFVERHNYSDGSKDYRQGNAQIGKPGSVKGIRNTLYHLPALIRTVTAGGVVWLVEGEKSADALEDVLPNGEVATTQRMGASQPWPDDFTETLRGAGEVRIVADFDRAGFSRALTVGAALHAAKIPVTVWRGAVASKGADIVDHLVAMKSQSELVRLTSRDLKAQIKEWEEESNDDSTPEILQAHDDDVWPGANTPYSVAQEYIARVHAHRDASTLAFWREDFYEWLASENRYREIESQELRRRFYRTLDGAVTQGANGLSPWTPTREKLNRVLDALQAEAHVSAELERSWRESREPAAVVAFKNGNLNIATKELTPPTPNLFTSVALPYDYDPDAPMPELWLKFLDQLWPGDADSKAVLQEWFGYVLSGAVNLHSMLAIVGPRRSGKSTIAYLLKQMVGDGNTTSPTLQSMLTSFGLQSWLNKTLAVIEDARFNPKTTEQVTELLLRISSGNAVEIDRKYKEPLSLILPTRIMYVSNEFPNIVDHSGALFSRFIFLRTTRSYYGIEDRELPDKLAVELPGILRWALDGMDRLAEREHFTTVRSMTEINQEIEEMQSPIKQFMRETCKRGGFTPTPSLYEAYQMWADRNGVRYVPTTIVFGRNLLAAYPELYKVQQRVGQRKDGKRVWGYPVTLLERSVRV